jgi:EAL domain-containing protein (putative c-di-GMP-specific phosphodiesterase class I)
VPASIVSPMPSPDPSLLIVGSVIQLADSRGLDSVAESVETQAVADLLTELKVGAMQGYLFSEPLQAAAFAAWLRDWVRA